MVILGGDVTGKVLVPILAMPYYICSADTTPVVDVALHSTG